MCDIWLGLLLSRWCSYRWFAVLLGSFCLRKYFKHFPQGDTWWQTQHLTKCESYWHTLALRLVFDPSLRFETVEVQTSSSSKFFKIQTKSFLMSFYLFAPPFLCCRPVVMLIEFWGSFLQLNLCFNLHILVAEVFLPFFTFTSEQWNICSEVMFLCILDFTGGRPPVPTHRCHPASSVDAENWDGGENRGSTQVGSPFLTSLNALLHMMLLCFIAHST